MESRILDCLGFPFMGNLSFVNSPVLYFTMATSGPSQLFVQLSSSEEGNWLSLGRALTSVLCRGLRPYIQREMDLFYSNVTAAVTALGGGPCTCVNDPGRKKNQYHDMSTCAWAQILEGVHIGNKPNWKQSDSTKWMDPENGQWEIAKLFRPDAGGHTVIESAEDLDISGILNIMYWCNHFTVQRPLIESVRQIRNTKWGHIPKSELSEAEKCAAFETIEGLLQDPVFVGDPHAQDALRDILALKCTSDVHIFKVKDLSHFEEAIRKDISDVKRKLKSLPGKKSKKNEKQKARLEIQVRNFKQALRKLEKKSATSLSSLFQILVLPIAFVGISIMNVGKMQRKSFISWIKLLLLCCCIVVLDHRSFKDGMFFLKSFLYRQRLKKLQDFFGSFLVLRKSLLVYFNYVLWYCLVPFQSFVFLNKAITGNPPIPVHLRSPP